MALKHSDDWDWDSEKASLFEMVLLLREMRDLLRVQAGFRTPTFKPGDTTTLPSNLSKVHLRKLGLPAGRDDYAPKNKVRSAAGSSDRVPSGRTGKACAPSGR